MQEAVKVVGWYYGAPKIEFLYRINQTVSMMGEKTTEVAIGRAVALTVQQLAVGLEEYSVYPDHTADPLCYHFFMETDALPPGVGVEEIRRTLEEHLCQINPSLGDKISRRLLGPIQLELLPAGTYQRYRRQRVMAGASAMQMKPPHVLIDQAQADFFNAAALGVMAHDTL